MDVITSVQDMIAERSSWSGSRVGLVPTMGYLHEGHLSLVRQARGENEKLAASIFVNPKQFGPREDLDQYPRDMPRDLRLLEEAGVDTVFAPTVGDMYPSEFVSYVVPDGLLSEVAEGAERPGHFRGVATVVLKLFEITRPHLAYFGQKDAQQAAVISHMVADFHLPITLRILPTVREADGLAMSSRNAYLSVSDRAAAAMIYQALLAGKRAFDSTPGGDPAVVVEAMSAVLASEPRIVPGYADVRHPYSFNPLDALAPPALLAIAARVGSTRLIDNVLLRSDGSWDTGIIVDHVQR